MSIVIEDGTGKADAETYISVSFFRDYNLKRGADTTAITDATVEELLRKSFDYMGMTYGAALKGQRTTSTQFGDFPRAYVDKPGYPGVYFDNNEIPLLWQQAQAELALIAQTTPLTPNVTRGKKRVKIGPLEVEYDGAAATATDFVKASGKVAPFLNGFAASGVIARVYRA